MPIWRAPSAPQTGPGAAGMATALREVAPSAWDDLASRTIEPNGYYLSPWALAVDAGARGRSHVDALCGVAPSRRLVALLPVVSAWRAYRLPLPVVVSAESYGTLHTPLLARDDAAGAARALLDDAATKGARAIVLRDVPLEGACRRRDPRRARPRWPRAGRAAQLRAGLSRRD